MSDTRSIPVSLTVSLIGEQFAALAEDVKAGGYESIDELVHDAL